MKIYKYDEYIKENLKYSLEDFIEKTKKDCKDNGVKLIMSDTTHVPYPVGNTLVNGYFIQYPEPTLAIATKKELVDWVSIFAHETSHMDQYLENSKVWTEGFIGKKETVDFIDEWIAGKEFSDDELDFFVEKTRDCELDCEIRTVEKIKKYNLPIDTTWYIKKSNAYVYFYTFIRKYRVWYTPGKEPYRIKEIVDLMPTSYNNDYSKLPKYMEEAYIKYCL